MTQPDPFNLQRFVDAQDSVWEQVVSELLAGKKQTCWMWYIFPQLAELGQSENAKYYGISSTEEATAYLAHPILGPRLELATRLIVAIAHYQEIGSLAIFGSTDDLKLQSPMTLFSIVHANGPYQQALDVFYVGAYDQRTCDIITKRQLQAEGRDDNGSYRREVLYQAVDRMQDMWDNLHRLHVADPSVDGRYIPSESMMRDWAKHLDIIENAIDQLVQLQHKE